MSAAKARMKGRVAREGVELLLKAAGRGRGQRRGEVRRRTGCASNRKRSPVRYFDFKDVVIAQFDRLSFNGHSLLGATRVVTPSRALEGKPPAGHPAGGRRRLRPAWRSRRVLRALAAT